MEIRLGEGIHILHPGDKAAAKRDMLHSFNNPTGETTTFLVELRPGHPGFERALKAGYGLARDGLVLANGVPRNLYHLAVLLEWSEMRLPGVRGMLEPVVWLLARRARRRGIDRSLEERYCR